jgi:predicted HicB family RNase H-like nuclease
MPYVNKKTLNIGVTEQVSKWVKEEARNQGMSASIYIEQLIRRQMKLENQLKAVQ